MSAPVVDHAKRAALQDIVSKSPFNIINIIAIIAILAIGYFLYKKFSAKFKKGGVRMPESPMIPPIKIEEIIETQQDPSSTG